ncbi:hypothetical protein RR46_02491 [Papilio xuthus]|uniref:Uncharacterized protein n=1 Tax=Papilio xuthus TaxID=66420 RepID=A0A194QH98_PAPXU|nr:hypothetical protein RR46_02491 [Papilio xuthus]
MFRVQILEQQIHRRTRWLMTPMALNRQTVDMESRVIFIVAAVPGVQKCYQGRIALSRLLCHSTSSEMYELWAAASSLTSQQ